MAEQSLWELFKELAKSPQKAAKKTAEDYPFVDKLSNLATKIAETPGMEVAMPMAGLTKGEMGASFLKSLFKRAPETSAQKLPTALPTTHRKAIADALRVVGKIPRKVLEELKTFSFDPQYEFRELSSPTTTGRFVWDRATLTGKTPVLPTKSFPEITVEPYMELGWPSRPAGTLGHEVGHAASKRILTGMKGSAPLKSSFYDTIKNREWEGVAEYLGDQLQRAAGVGPEQLTFPYGRGQRETYEVLKGMSSKNPYMNVYRYLQQLLGK